MLLVLTTFPDANVARLLGRQLVEEKLAACCSILPGVESIFWWQGKLESANEVQAILKTDESTVDLLMTRLDALHPYEVPEILVLRPDRVSPAYAQWVKDSVRAAE